MTRRQFSEVRLSATKQKQALLEFHRQLTKWALKMPKVKPLVLDFGLGKFDKTGLIEFWLANETKAGYCGKFLFVFDGQTCPYHRHKIKHETFFVVKGQVQMKAGGKTKLLKEGDRLVMPPGVGHSFQGAGPALLLEVSQPCVAKDNFFQNEQIGQDGVI